MDGSVVIAAWQKFEDGKSFHLKCEWQQLDVPLLWRVEAGTWMIDVMEGKKGLKKKKNYWKVWTSQSCQDWLPSSPQSVRKEQAVGFSSIFVVLFHPSLPKKCGFCEHLEKWKWSSRFAPCSAGAQMQTTSRMDRGAQMGKAKTQAWFGAINCQTECAWDQNLTTKSRDFQRVLQFNDDLNPKYKPKYVYASNLISFGTPLPTLPLSKCVRAHTFMPSEAAGWWLPWWQVEVTWREAAKKKVNVCTKISRDVSIYWYGNLSI